MKIAILTDTQHPDLTTDDQLLRATLAPESPSEPSQPQQQHQQPTRTITPIPWNSSTTNWQQFDLALIRSTWDYHLQLETYLTTLMHIATQTKLINPYITIKWNSDKIYLKDLEQLNIPIPKTIFTDDPAQVTPGTVVKPRISASAKDTYLIAKDTSAQNLIKPQPLLIQEFLPSVQSEGEYSFIFFNNQISHTVLKRPKPKDFRVQEEHGGSTTLITPTKTDLTQAQRVLAALEKLNIQHVYARIDMARHHETQTLCLMEVELIEPSLFFSYAPHSAAKFAQALFS